MPQEIIIKDKVTNQAVTVTNGKLDVNASVSAGDSAIVDGVDSGIAATVRDYTNSNPLAVVLTDSNGDYTAAGGGTEYTEGDVDTTITGKAVLGEGPSNTLTPLQIDASGLLQVDLAADSVGIGGGTQYTEGDTDATITGTAIMWEDAADTLVTVNSSKPLPVNVTNEVEVTLNSEEVAINDGGNSITVDGNIAAAQLGSWDINAVTTLPDVDINDISKGVQTNDIKVTLDSEAVVLGAGTAAFGKLVANSGVDIGDVTINNASGAGVYVRPGTAAAFPVTDNAGSLTIDNATLSVTGGGTETGALRVTIANNSTGVVSVDDNGSSLTIDGTVTANLSATDNTVLDNIDTSTSTIAGAVSGTEMQVDVLTMPEVAINDGGNVITVDGTVSAAQSGTWNITTLTGITNDVSIDDGGNSITVDGTVTNESNYLVQSDVNSYDVDNSAILVFDASVNATTKYITITNAGDLSIFLYSTSSVTQYLNFKKLVAGESYGFPRGYSSDATNDVYAIRSSAATNDNVIVTEYTYA